MTNEEFFRMLESHDWFYEYSDDHGVWTKGKENKKRIQATAQENPLFSRMYSEYVEYINAVVSHGPNQEKVARPFFEDYE